MRGLRSSSSRRSSNNLLVAMQSKAAAHRPDGILHVLMQLLAVHCCAQGIGVLAQGQRHTAARRYIHAGTLATDSSCTRCWQLLAVTSKQACILARRSLAAHSSTAAVAHAMLTLKQM
jgi:hypothetical protein